MALITKEAAQALLKKVLSYSKAEECEVNMSGRDSANIRYARNQVSTSGAVSSTSLQIASAFGKKLGIVTLNELDDSSIQNAVQRSEELAKLAPENPEYVPFVGPQQYGPPSKMYAETTVAAGPKERTDAVSKSLEVAKAHKLNAAGFLENSTGYTAMMNTKGLFAYETDSALSFSITMRTEDGKGSGYVTKGYNDFSKLDTKGSSEISAKKALGSVAARSIEPGKYTVILEPTAVAVLLENITFSMDERSADEGRSFLSKAGGKTRLGEQLVDPRVNIYSDPWHPELPGSTFNGEGLPLRKTHWIEKGVVKNMPVSRYWAAKKGKAPLPGPNGVIMDGGSKSLDELIKGTEKGILVTRLYYIRSVDPQTLLLTGLTRDGTFYIENGEIKFPIKNFRFNESPVIMLNNLEELGIPERTVSDESNNNYLIPPLKIRDFNFTSLSDAV